MAQELTALEFFKHAQPHSIAKAEIVSKYIIGWANIVVRFNMQRLGTRAPAYVVDLFSGCGQYEDGFRSTPLKVIEEAVKHDHLLRNLVLRFNDESAEMIARLEKYVADTPGADRFLNPIRFSQHNADSPEIARWFASNANGPKIPMLVFIDPFGYKEISQALLRSIIQVPQSDIILFFNYKRVNAALDNDLFASNMNRLFGHARVQRIKSELDQAASPAARTAVIVRHLEESLQEIGGRFVVPYVVVPEDETQTSHYIVGISKHEKGFELMKKIMKQHSKISDKAPSRFGHDPRSLVRDLQQSLFDAPPNLIGDLAKELQHTYGGQSVTFEELYRKHHCHTHYVEAEYKAAIEQLLIQKKIIVTGDSPVQPVHRKGRLTFGNQLKIRFL